MIFLQSVVADWTATLEYRPLPDLTGPGWQTAGYPVSDEHVSLSERDRAALEFAEAVVSGGCAGELPEIVLQRTRLFSDGEIAELTRCLADHHLLNDAES
jgi:alkylhydroperoxidase family enzyme